MTSVKFMKPAVRTCWPMGLVMFGLMPVLAAAVNEPALQAFQQKVEGYVKVRKTAEGKVKALPKNANPEQIHQYRTSLASLIREARATAKPGDIFVTEIRPIFLSILKDNFTGPGGRANRAVARQGNPQHEKEPGEATPKVQVNAVYPASAPVSSVPPMLLMQLPKLPKDIEYRFSGPTLLLLDTKADLIIDYMRGAAPGL